MSAFLTVRPRLWLMAPLLLVLTTTWTLFAALQQVRAVDSEAALSKIAWLTGNWQSKNGDETTDECWLSPHANSMVGMCRIATPDKVIVYEFMLIEQASDGSVTMSMRHYRWNMEDRDQAPIRWKLSKTGEREALFETTGDRFASLQYEKVNENQLRITLIPKPDPKARMKPLVFDFNRTDAAMGK